MTSFLAHYGIWLLAAFAVGVLTALISGKTKSGETRARLRQTDFIFAVCILIFTALVQVMFGRLALYFASALAIFVAFLVGERVGAAFIGSLSRDHKSWRLGLTSAAVIWLMSSIDARRALEADLIHQVGTVVERAGGNPLNLYVSGRDVFLPGDMADRAALAGGILRVAGVRYVLGVDRLTDSAAELRDKELAAAAAARLARNKLASAQTIAWKAPASATEPAAERVVEARSVAATPIDGLASGALSAKEIVGAETLQIAAAAATPSAPANLDDAAACQTDLSALVMFEKIRFEVASAAIRRPAAQALDELAGALKRCPNVKVEVGGHTDSRGDNKRNWELSRRRAQAVVDYLGREGVERDMLTGVGYGAQKPVASNDTEDSRAQNRRVEFTVR